jgi:hypothetical protein
MELHDFKENIVRKVNLICVKMEPLEHRDSEAP